MTVDVATGWDLFAHRAEAIGASVVRTPRSNLATVLPERFVATRSARERFGLAGSTDAADDVVAAAEFGVLETGSVALNEPADDRGRCFLAERLWLLVPQQSLVSDLGEALERIGAMIREGAGHPLLMSGPSRTADIERILTIGVHGPRALTIIVVDAD